MAKGAQVKELLKALQLKEQELRGPGVEGTGKEMMPVNEAGVDSMFERLEEMRDQYDMDSPEWNELNEKIGTLTETFGTLDNPTPFTQAMESLELPDMSRRNFLKGLAATATPNPLSILGDLGEVAADLPIAPMAKMAVDTVSKLPTTRIELLKPVYDIVDDLYQVKKEEIIDDLYKANPGAKEVDMDLVDWYASKEALEEEAFELGNEWHNYPFGGEGHLEMLDKVRDEVEALLWDGGLDRDVARELAETIEDATWPEFQEFDAANAWHAGAAFETDINAPQEVLDLIDKVIDGQDLGDWQAMKQEHHTIVSRPKGLRVESDIVRKKAKGGVIKAIVDPPNRELEMLRQYHRGSTTQIGMFSTLDELIKGAPFETNSGEQWMSYLKPGRMLKREGMQFPLKADEIKFADGALQQGLKTLLLDGKAYTKQELRDIITKSRMPFEATMARENFDLDGDLVSPDDSQTMPRRWRDLADKYDMEFDMSDIPTHREISTDVTSGLNLDRAKWGANYSAEGRLYTQSPGSRYEESVTRVPSVGNKQGHFSPDTLSWSRTSSHDYRDKSIEGPLQTVRVRLVDEIQSDVHRQAAKFHWENDAGDYLNPWQFEEMKASNPSLMEFNPVEWKKIRQGYFTADNKLKFEDLEDQLEVIENQLYNKKQEGALGRDFDEDPYVIERRAAKDKITDEISMMSDMVSDLPYKSPGDYAALELRKQLSNAVDNDEGYLALVRGSDQLERYSGMSDEAAANSEHFYDNVYRKELQKLANRYGAPMEDIKLDVGETSDLRTPNMIDWNMEGPGDMAENVIDMMAEGSGSDGAMAIYALQEDVGYLANRMAHEDYEKTFKLDTERSKLNELHTELDEMGALLSKEGAPAEPGASNPAGSMLAEAAGDEAMQGFTARGTLPGFEVTTKEQGIQPHLDAYKNLEDRLMKIGEELNVIYNEYAFTMQTGEEVIKSFPALKITPEVRDKVLKVGVPQYQEGGLVREKDIEPMAGGMSALSLLRRPDYRMSEEEEAEVIASLKESDFDRETQELMKSWDYWQDTLKRVPAVMSSMWKTLNEDTGEAEWIAPMQPMRPYIGMSEEDLQGMVEYNKMVRENNRKFRPGIIDDTIGVASLGYAGYDWARGAEEDDRTKIPDTIMDAMNRSQELMETIEQDWELGEARGIPQHLATGLGVMGGQIPTPKSAAEALFEGVGRVAKPVTRRLPDAVNKAGNIAMFPVKAGAEFFDPTVNPKFRNYLIGTGFGGALGKYAEEKMEDRGDFPRSYEEVKEDRELEALQEKQYFDIISDYTAENWDDLPLKTQFGMLSNKENPEVSTTVWEALTQEQQQDLLQAADEAGMFAEEDEEPAEYAKGGYIKELVKLRGNVLEAEDLFTVKRFEDDVQRTIEGKGIDFNALDESIDTEWLAARLKKLEAKDPSGLNAARLDAIDEFDEIWEMSGDAPHGYDLEEMLEITENIDNNKFRGILHTDDGALRFTYDVSELDPGKTFIWDEIDAE